MSATYPVADLFDEYGFLIDPELWNRDMALAIAAELGIAELTDLHWQVIDHIRPRYIERDMLTSLTHECHELKLDRDCIHRLFGGPVEAWKVAGLPDPGEEARSYMESEEPL